MILLDVLATLSLGGKIRITNIIIIIKIIIRNI